MEEGRSKDRYRSLARSYAIDSRMWETHDYGKVCSDCAMEHSSKLNISLLHMIDNQNIIPRYVVALTPFTRFISGNIVQCTKKLRREEEYKECFQKILDKDENRPDYKKCATCTCKQLRINMRLDVEDYPDLKNMFCFLGKRNAS